MKDANGNKLKLTDKGNDKYTFIMPKVTVFAEFVEERADSTFTDVPADAYYAKAVESGVTRFSPNNGCTRAQIVTFLYRAYQGK